MDKKLGPIPTPQYYQKRLKNLLFFLAKDYSSLTKGNHSPREEKLCLITKELDNHYKETGIKEYKQVKEKALIRYSEIVMNCKCHGSRYGGLSE
jgi:hypothetical protein